MLAANTFSATTYGDFSQKSYNEVSQYVPQQMQQMVPQMQQMQQMQQMAPMPDCSGMQMPMGPMPDCSGMQDKMVYRHDPYAAPSGAIPSGPIASGPIPEAPSCMQTRMPAEFYWSTPYEYTQCATFAPVQQEMQVPQQAFAVPQQVAQVPQVPQQAFAKAWYVSAPAPAYQMVQTEIPAPPAQKPKEEIQEAPASIFDGCRTKNERRTLAILVITKGLQQGKNRTYGAARRKMTKWAQLQGICKEDLQLMVEYLNELCLAGATYEYDAAGVPASTLAVGVSENAVGNVAHLLSVDEMWEGCLNYITPADCHARRGKKDEQA